MKTSDVILYFGVWSILMTSLWIALSVYLWISMRGGVGPADLRETAHKAHQRIDELNSRCITVEERMRALPTHADLVSLSTTIHRIGGDVRNLHGQIDGIQTATARMETSLATLIEHHLHEPQQ